MCEVVLGFSGMLLHNNINKIDCLAKDLEAFSNHAKRTTINPSDVRLAARKQPHIISKLDEMVNGFDEEKKKRRKKD